MGRPPEYAPGYPSAANTTVTAFSGRKRSGSAERVPVAAPWSTGRRSEESRGSSACASGSPNRMLNSSTLGPPGVSISPA